jgi:ribosome maturation factor RimP
LGKWRTPLFFLKNQPPVVANRTMNIAEITEKQVTEKAKEALQAVSSTGQAELSLHKITFFHSKGNTRIVIQLDKESDKFGSVNINECESYSRVLRTLLDELETTTAINLNYSLEVSSVGAERELTSVADVRRFSALPLSVTFDSTGKVLSEVLQTLTVDGDTIEFKLADCKANRKKYSPKKLREALPYKVSWNHIKKIRLHLDV